MAATPNICAGPLGAAYSFYIERPWLMQAIGRLLWGIDSTPIYETLRVLESVPDGATVADVPCGGGLALRALSPSANVRYLAGDIDETMLARTRERAAALGLGQVETLRADMAALPFADGSIDLFMCVSGLHMIDAPAAALIEIGRVLRPGGELHGTTFVREGAARQRRLFAAGARRGHPEPPRLAELRVGLESAGLQTLALAPESGMVAFRARRRS
jgi:SAM-dependent methyltransferase